MREQFIMDICAGIGGFSLAGRLIAGWRTVCYVEIDPYCQRVLQARIKDGYLDDAPIYSDLRTFDGRPWRGCVDIITAGFPCQPFSVAGKRLGEKDERNLWPELKRVIHEVLPATVFLENVPTLLAGETAYAGRVFGDLAACGYDIRWDCIPASSVSANHRRDRVWIVGNSERGGFSGDTRRGTRAESENRCEDVADTNSSGTYQPRARTAERTRACDSSWWAVEPDVGRVAHGVPNRVGKLKSLGNAIVPEVARKAWEILKCSDE